MPKGDPQCHIVPKSYCNLDKSVIEYKQFNFKGDINKLFMVRIKICCLSECLSESADGEIPRLQYLNNLIEALPRGFADYINKKSSFKSKLQTYGGFFALSELLNSLSVPYENLLVNADSEGRPFLEGELPLCVDFNISHSGDYAVCAVATGEGARVGIDIEHQSYEKEHRGRLVKRFFYPQEVETYFNQGESADCFLRIWTQKEAVMKYKGDDIHNQLLCINTAVLENVDFETEEFSVFEDTRDYSVLPDNATDDDIKKFMDTCKPDTQYLITVCYPKGMETDFVDIY